MGKGVAFAVVFVAVEHLEAHAFVKPCGVGVLLVDIDEFHVQFLKGALHKPFAQPFAEIGGVEEEHLYLLPLYAHEADGFQLILHDPERLNLLQGFFGLRGYPPDVCLRQETMAGADGCFPDV